MPQPDHTSTLIHRQCDELLEHVKQLRDYATTPNNAWLAKSELQRLQALVSEIEQSLQRLDRPS